MLKEKKFLEKLEKDYFLPILFFSLSFVPAPARQVLCHRAISPAIIYSLYFRNSICCGYFSKTTSHEHDNHFWIAQRSVAIVFF
jgi:hypothetical protein